MWDKGQFSLYLENKTLIAMSNIRNIEKFLRDALLRVKDEDGTFDASLLDCISDDEYDYPEFENQLMEIELSLNPDLL